MRICGRKRIKSIETLNKRRVIITAPSLDPAQNVSGVSSVVQFIINHNRECEYEHFQIGKTDRESGGPWQRLTRTWRKYREWRRLTAPLASPPQGETNKAIVHYSFPLSAPSIMRDPWFMHYALKQGVKMVVHVHGGLFLTAPRIPYVLERMLKWVFSWDVPFIVLSEGEKDILMKRFGAKRVEVLPNCPEIPSKSPLMDGFLSKDLIVGYLGRIEPNKGMTELLCAMGRLKADGKRVKVRFAGKEQTKGEYIPKYEDALGEDFEYCGLVSDESKKEFLCSLDVFVMPTYFEGLPMSLLETMSYGAVPVVTKVGSIPTVVREGENGLFVEKKDVDSIVEAIRRLDDDRTLLAHLSEEARKTIMEKFSAEKYVERLNEIYCSL